MRVARVLDAHLTEHLPDDDLDVLVVDLHALRPVHVLHLRHEVGLGLGGAVPRAPPGAGHVHALAHRHALVQRRGRAVGRHPQVPHLHAVLAAHLDLVGTGALVGAACRDRGHGPRDAQVDARLRLEDVAGEGRAVGQQVTGLHPRAVRQVAADLRALQHLIGDRRTDRLLLPAHLDAHRRLQRDDRPAGTRLVIVDVDPAVMRRHVGEGLRLAGLEELDDSREALRDVRAGDAAGVEGAHGQLRAGLADRLRGDDAHRVAGLAHLA